MTLIYKICESAMWREAERLGVFTGAEIDIQDGYIHFSTAAQVAAPTTSQPRAEHFASKISSLEAELVRLKARKRAIESGASTPGTATRRRRFAGSECARA